MSFGLVGENLSHSYSPLIHNMIGAYKYELFKVAPDNLEKFIKDGCFSGLNITFPYKSAVMKFVKADKLAENLGAINTIYRKDGELRGTNTDYFGFMYLLSLSKVNLQNQKILICGTGGSSKMVQHIAQECKASKIFIASRNPSKDYVSYDNLPIDCDVIINTTPVGTYPKSFERIINLESFNKCHTIIDLIYNPSKTDLILQGEARGIKCINGLSMLVAQATKAAQFFIGIDLIKHNKNILKNIEISTSNIALVGMPGSGKSTLGKSIATLMGRKFIDIDKVIINETGKSIPEIFQTKGEAYFRQLETEVLHRFAKESQLVISTGGGSILSQENQNALLANSTIIEVTRPLDMLIKDNRPILKNTSIEKLFEERKDIYKNISHISIKNDSNVEIIAKKILKKIGEFYEKDYKLK